MEKIVTKSIIISFKGCARCGGNHKTNCRPLTDQSGRYTHWTMCPKLLEPIMVRSTVDKPEKAPRESKPKTVRR